MKLYDLYLFEALDPNNWENDSTESGSTAKKYAQAIKKFDSAQHQYEMIIKEVRIFREKYLVYSSNPAYAANPHKFEDGKLSKYAINIPAANDPTSLIRKANKLFDASASAGKYVDKCSRQLAKYKKQLKVEIFANLAAQPKKTIPPDQIPVKIKTGTSSFGNPYFASDQKRYAGSIGHYELSSYDQRTFFDLQQCLLSYGISGFTTIMASSLGNTDYFVAFAADGKFIWKRNGASNRYFANGKKVRWIDDHVAELLKK